jgi:2-aminoadipate transaminase
MCTSALSQSFLFVSKEANRGSTMTPSMSVLYRELEPRLPVRLAGALASMGQSTLREILVSAAAPGIRSFAIGMPGTDLFPSEDMARAASELLTGDIRALQYGPPSAQLKKQVVELMRLRGVETREEQVFLTAGSQQAMDLLTRLLLEPGGSVVVEDTIYDGIQMVVRPLAPHVLTVPTSPVGGLDLDALEALLASGERPTFLYVIPEGHNPMGTSMSYDSRVRLVEISRRYGLPILEDDAYGLLRLDDGQAPPLRALDGERVFYLGSFSKILAPALRVGWIVLPEEQPFPVSALKHGTDLDTTTFAQRLLTTYLASGRLSGHVDGLRAEYRRRRDAMLGALDRHMPAGVRWHPPSAGIFVWVELPEGSDTTELLREAIETEQVAFCPGRAFSPRGESHVDHCLRLSYADSTPEQIEEGIERLARAVRSSLRVARMVAAT